jgi:hypothetical protein
MIMGGGQAPALRTFIAAQLAAHSVPLISELTALPSSSPSTRVDN